jgi:hypothetical protein
MSLVGIMIVVVILALFLWAISMIPIEPRLKTVLYVVLAVLLIIWLISQLGGVHGISLK